MCEVNNGFLFTKKISTSSKTEQQRLDPDWTRRWFQLHNTGILKCYNSCYADQLVFELDLRSEHVSSDDVIYPESEYGKPWILSVMMREREEKLFLEADCEECMKKWAKFILIFLSTEIRDVNILNNESLEQNPIAKPKVPLKPRVRLSSKSSTGYSNLHSQTQKIDNKEGALIYEYIDLKESSIYAEVNYTEFLPDSTLQVSSLIEETSLKISSFNSLPDYKVLLANFWPLCFVLPNGKVYTQLIDLTVCIQESLQSLLSCFQHSYPSPNSYLTLQVIGDLYQTYKPHKSSKKKEIQFVEWNNSFSNQGVETSKVVKVSFIQDTDVSLSTVRLEELIYRLTHNCESELFCLTWVSFVKGCFPVMDMSVSALYSACTYFVYKRIPGNEDVEIKNFIPSHLQKLSHINTVKKEIEHRYSSDTMSMLTLFFDNLNRSLYGNAMSFPVVMIKRSSFRSKKINCVFVFCKQHILIIGEDNRGSSSDNILALMKFTQVRGWFIQSDDNILFIQLSLDLKSQDNLIFETPSAECINFLLLSLSPKEYTCL